MKKKIRLRDLKFKNLRFRRRRSRVGLVILGIVSAALIGFNFWFIDHSESALEDIVASQSNGKLKLKVRKFRFNWINNRIELTDALLYTTDSSANTISQFTTRNIRIKARGVLPLLFKKQILIDSILVDKPKVLITKINQNKKKPVQQDRAAIANKEDFSVARELGKVANSINDAIRALQINTLVLNDGTFSLVDKTISNANPFVVNRINIRLENLQMDEATQKKSKNKIAFTDDIAIQTSNQHMAFPGGRHLLSFKNFKLSLSDQRVVFDSCTIRGIKGDSSKTAFRIFFDQLALTKINFDALYAAEIIQADSVFCLNPDIVFNIDSDVETSVSDQKKIQNVDELVQQLLGDVMLNYVIVNNAEININTIRHGQTNTFASAKNNFELQGLEVRQNKKRPVSVQRLYMSLYNYETALQNGRYSIAFDSVRFEGDALTLTNFRFKEYGKKKLLKNLKMPGLEVRGLSWEALLYENRFEAANAQFYKPDIMVSVTPKKQKPRRNLFSSLSELGRVMGLARLVVNDGNIVLKLNEGGLLTLNNTGLALSADDLTASTKLKNIQHAIHYLDVSKARFSKGLLNLVLNNLSLTENHRGLRVADMELRDDGLHAGARGINIRSIILDSAGQMISVDGLRWSSGRVSISDRETVKKKQTTPAVGNLQLSDISGGSTAFEMVKGDKRISAFLTAIHAHSIYKPATGAMQINGLQLAGRDAIMRSPGQELSIASLNISDRNNSLIRDFYFAKTDDVDSVLINVPRITIIPDITQIASGGMFLRHLILTDPDITAKLGKKDPATAAAGKPASQIRLGEALLQRPLIRLTLMNNENQPSYIFWNGVKENSFMKFTDFLSTRETPIDASRIEVYLTNFEYINTKGKRIATNDNKLNLRFDDVLVQKNRQNKTDWKTSASILSLDKLFFDSLGKDNAVLTLDKGDVRNISLNSKFMANAADVIKNSTRLNITGTNGSYTSALNKINWYQLTFDKGFFSADSFSLAPRQSIENYKIKKAFDQDYLMVRAGKLFGGPVDMLKYAQDSFLQIGGLQINNIRLLTFKDKRQEDTATKEKPLPVTQILKIPGKLQIDSVRLKDMYVEYWEINPKTDTLGIVPISDLNVLAHHIKNFNIRNDDSLYIYASAHVINSLFTALELKQSYKDPPGTFLMKLKTGPVDLKKFNQVLLPLEAIEVLGGKLDSLSLETVANNDFSMGQMRMFYDGLSLRLMNKKDFTRQHFLNKLFSRIGAIFIIRKHNEGKRSPVFFERRKERSAVNFLIKTTVSGLKSGVGLPGLKSKQRRYLRKQKKLHRALTTPGKLSN